MIKHFGDLLSSDWQASIIFEKGEKVVASWKGDREIREKAIVDGRSTETTKYIAGVIVLTNQRFIFLKEHGIFRKSYHQSLVIPLEKIGAISMGGFLTPFVSISDGVETYIFHIQGVGKREFEPFRQLIVEQCQKRKEEVEVEKKKERIHLMIDFSFIKDYMKQGGLVLQTFKCPSCGAPLKFPESGNTMTCPYCNSNIRAEDIFEKIKALI